MIDQSLDEKLKAPITLIGHGRSGTSLLQNIFFAHPDISVAGETADLIFGTWYSIKKAEGLVPGLEENGSLVPWQELRSRGVRAVLGEIIDFKRKFWMQKPIAQPFLMSYLKERGKMTEIEWFDLYWSILEDVFPNGKFITILRHPYDVVLSSMEYWGREQADVWSNMATMAQCILHRSSKVTYAVDYQRLVEDPAASLEDLFSHIAIPYDASVLKAFDHVYVSDKKGWKQDKKNFPEKIKKKFSRRSQWDRLDLSLLKPEQVTIIGKMWNHFGSSWSP